MGYDLEISKTHEFKEKSSGKLTKTEQSQAGVTAQHGGAGQQEVVLYHRYPKA